MSKWPLGRKLQLPDCLTTHQLQVLRTANWGAGKLQRRQRGEQEEGRSWTSQEWKGLQDEDKPKRTNQRTTSLSGLCLKISFGLRNLFLPRDAFCWAMDFFLFLFEWINLPVHFKPCNVACFYFSLALPHARRHTKTLFFCTESVKTRADFCPGRPWTLLRCCRLVDWSFASRDDRLAGDVFRSSSRTSHSQRNA